MIWIIFVALCWDSAFSLFPNERSSLNDCRDRFYRHGNYGIPFVGHGLPTHAKEFPHMAAIGWTESKESVKWLCGGSLVWFDFVLTAAHCISDGNGKRPDVVRLGDVNLYRSDDDQGVQQFRILKIFRHPEYKIDSCYHDIALFQLDKAIVMTPFVIPACLWREEEIRFKTLLAAGWGRTGYGKGLSPYLQKITLKPIPNEECDEFYIGHRKLKLGLQTKQICAHDTKMDTCEGDSGGPLQVNLLHNGRLTPFIVGVTSHGVTCGMSFPGVYTKVSSYFEWIVDIMQQNSIAKPDFYNETTCALRFINFRGYYEKHDYFNQNNMPDDINVIAKIHWNAKGPDCYGVIIDEDTVLTVADCSTFRGNLPSFITYLDDKVTPISKIFVHPGYIQGSAYNNIAILKLSNLLDLPNDFLPSCISEYNEHFLAFMIGKGRRDMNTYVRFRDEVRVDPREGIRKMQTFLMNTSTCVVPEQYHSRLPNGLGPDLFCFGNDVFLVPQSCEQLTGSMVGYKNGPFYQTFALSQFSRDCGFGEHLISTRLDRHIEWLKSKLLPYYRDTSAVQYVDKDLQEGDSCILGGGLKGRCVPTNTCIDQLNQSTGQATFCLSSTVICCSLQNINASNRIHPDIINCPSLIDSLGETFEFGALVNIGWCCNKTLVFRCHGSIISQSYVITTASCLLRQPRIVQLNNTGALLVVDSFLKHPDFNLTDRTNDIALIKLKKPLSWNSTVYPVCLWTNLTHTPLKLDINFEPSNDDNPKKFHPMYHSDCQRFYPYVFADSQLCARSPYKDAVCVARGDQLTTTEVKIEFESTPKFEFDSILDSDFVSTSDMENGMEYFKYGSIPHYMVEMIENLANYQYEPPLQKRVLRESYLVGLSTNACDRIKWKYPVFTRISAFLEWISTNAF